MEKISILGINASPRRKGNSHFLLEVALNAAKALALVRGRDFCLPDDVKELAPIVLSHRVMLSRAQGMRVQSFEHAERIVLDIVDTIPVPV